MSDTLSPLSAAVDRRRVAVLLGGLSAEREISLVTGRACAEALRRTGYDVVEIDAGWDVAAQLAAATPDVVFNGLHGAWGEDGRVQGVLDHARIPYTHSGVLASALAMDKPRAKDVFRAAGIDVPVGRTIQRADLAAGHPMETPYVLKPPAEGSAVGVFVVEEGAAAPPSVLIDPARGTDWDLGEALLVEEYIPGQELTVTVMGDRPLAVTEIVPATGFYDYDAKYAPGGSRHILPAPIPPAVERACLDLALKAHEILGCLGLTRSDFRYDLHNDRLCLLELNTQPGMTPTSLAPEQAAHCGVAFDDLVAWMVEDASWPR